ncbi:MAG TPA: type II toxin-antitoxin system VapC family toxin [Anaerolineales bacterium]|nr:type II toxin-antitoxin system VapC family toxin [Anaerolineales bacterium]HMR99207.1 type II toxin-antitoxin system VapC family toxin [Anaerolineales bacterium]HNQ96029.1 type II toxin-antitoxin system VapC family toxin [Anaerolineales bacterium]HNS61039.1 type II toxin-antitoxin system VapC family toxin [Anaerolineales bacterium]
MQNSVVLDAYAILAFFQNEPGADSVRKLILEAVDDRLHLAMSVVNAGEVWYSLARRHSTETADAYMREIQSMPIEIVEVDWDLARQAALYKMKGNISYADCFAAALTKLRSGELVTGDKEFKSLASEIKITWLK